ncbi:MAG: DUF6090 family protein [Henriciella sp.]
MLLRRITKHVKDQNWFAIALDFLIVVVGILIAFQITNWNEARNERKQEHVWLIRLNGDFDRIIVQGSYLNPHMKEQIPAIQRVIAHIRSENLPEFEGEFVEDLKKINQVWVNMEFSATYTELVATGELSKIRNENLRDKLATYRRSNEADEVLLNSQLGVRDSIAIDRAIQYSVADTKYETTYVPIGFHWDKLVELEPELQVIYRTQILREQWQSQSLDTAFEIKSLLKQELE